MKPINIDALKKLVKRYETITFEEVKTIKSKKLLTGFGYPYNCVLCSSIYEQVGKVDCEQCVYFSALTDLKSEKPCYSGPHQSTYRVIEAAKTSEELFNAYKARAKHIKETFPQYFKEPIAPKQGVGIYKKIKSKLLKKYLFISITLFLLGLLTLISHHFDVKIQILKLTLGIVTIIWFAYDIYITMIFRNLSHILQLRNQHRMYIALLHHYKYGSEKALEVIDLIYKSEPMKFGIIHFKTIPYNQCLIVKHIIENTPSITKEETTSLLLILNKKYNKLQKKLS